MAPQTRTVAASSSPAINCNDNVRFVSGPLAGKVGVVTKKDVKGSSVSYSVSYVEGGAKKEVVVNGAYICKSG